MNISGTKCASLLCGTQKNESACSSGSKITSVALGALFLLTGILLVSGILSGSSLWINIGWGFAASGVVSLVIHSCLRLCRQKESPSAPTERVVPLPSEQDVSSTLPSDFPPQSSSPEATPLIERPPEQPDSSIQDPITESHVVESPKQDDSTPPLDFSSQVMQTLNSIVKQLSNLKHSFLSVESKEILKASIAGLKEFDENVESFCLAVSTLKATIENTRETSIASFLGGKDEAELNHDIMVLMDQLDAICFEMGMRCLDKAASSDDEQYLIKFASNFLDILDTSFEKRTELCCQIAEKACQMGMLDDAFSAVEKIDKTKPQTRNTHYLKICYKALELEMLDQALRGADAVLNSTLKLELCEQIVGTALRMKKIEEAKRAVEKIDPIAVQTRDRLHLYIDREARDLYTSKSWEQLFEKIK